MASRGKVAIVGSGFIGQSWAMIFAGGGYEVALYDAKAEQVTGALESIKAQLKRLDEEGVLRGSLSVEDQLRNVSAAGSLEDALRGAVWAQESVFEAADLKRQVYSEMDKYASANTILASSTSCIAPDDIMAHVEHKANCLVCHPVNPPYYCPAVEVVLSSHTDPAVVEKATAILTEIGQAPVLVKKQVFGFVLNRMQSAAIGECKRLIKVFGFVLNRIQFAIIGEAMRLIKEDVCTAQDVDRVVSEGLGLRYAFLGPLAVAHLNAPKGFTDYSERYGASIVKTQNDFGPVPEFTPELVAKIAGQLETVIPNSSFDATMKWRNQCLAQLAKLKKENPPPK